jgi:hypothetical protein
MAKKRGERLDRWVSGEGKGKRSGSAPKRAEVHNKRYHLGRPDPRLPRQEISFGKAQPKTPTTRDIIWEGPTQDSHSASRKVPLYLSLEGLSWGGNHFWSGAYEVSSASME